MDGLGPEYVANRNAMIAAVTLNDVKRVSRKLLETQTLLSPSSGKPTLGAIAKND
jgi:zinc protease